jgi:hypothetical protein|tara:strand:- start:20099 stop:20332 length:234 start_codon:yes stop_codon:yes gene_type:complete
MAIKKQQLSEDSQWNLDRLFKLTMTGFFGSEMIDKAAKKRALKDPAIKKKMKELYNDLEDMQVRLDKVKAMSSSAIK